MDQVGGEDLVEVVAGLSDEKLSEHLEKDARGEFSEPGNGQDTPEKEAGGKTPEAGKTDGEESVETLKKQNKDKDDFIGRQSNEIGNLRQRLAALEEMARRNNKQPEAGHPAKAEPAEEVIPADKFFENPVENISKIVEKTVSKILSKQKADSEQEKSAAESEKAKADEARLSCYSEVAKITDKDEFSTLAPVIVQILQDDGISPEEIAHFEKDPFSYSPRAIINLVKRARLEQKLSGKPAPSSGAPAKTPSGPASLNPKTGRGSEGSKGPRQLSQKQVADMTDEELDAYYKQLEGNN